MVTNYAAPALIRRPDDRHLLPREKELRLRKLITHNGLQQYLSHNFAMHIGQTHIAPTEAVR